MKRFSLIFAALMLPFFVLAQTDYAGVARFDKTVHDFGDLTVDQGPVSCTFTLTNISGQPFTVNSVVPGCGCTGVKWSRNSIEPGSVAQIRVTYKNEDGAYPFDKTLTVYLSCVKKPFVLHIRGVVRKAKLPLAQSFPVHFGPLAMRGAEIDGGNLLQGERKSGELTVANISDKPLTLEFSELSRGLAIRCKDKTIPAGGTSSVVFTVTAMPDLWGSNWYYATPVINGESFASVGKEQKQTPVLGADAVVVESNPALAEGSRRIGILAVTAANFSTLTKSDKVAAPIPDFTRTSLSYGNLKAGRKFTLRFECVNRGEKALTIYKMDCRSSRLRMPSSVPQIEKGKKVTLALELDTAGMSPGEHLFVINVYTNSPINPVVSLYATGIVE
ncbi:MAG: DUF1573 domain-containing protein [Bacteroidales bacterium]|nr:DUF1573 domain-containing protein [Bacteroidales bacterium]